MSIIICPGIHESAITQSFMDGWQSLLSDSSKPKNSENILIFPAQGFSALSGFHIVQFMYGRLGDRLESTVVFISFSAGVVGSIAAAWTWQLLGGNVKAFIAFDGWGVPLGGNFPIHRISHDDFTHWSSSCRIFGGEDDFYAQPAVEHLQLWRSPQTTQGYWVNSCYGGLSPHTPISAAEFLVMLLERYGEI
ncbi:MAG: hypothetical protein VKL59_21855 [Nostocaceae cyanobacterium]|nr:hypothetical protein [Nostocaceae cyanobacterium]